MNPFSIDSPVDTISSKIFLAISPKTLPPSHFDCGDGRLSSHAGRKSWKMLQTHPPSPASPRQKDAMRKAVDTSWVKASMVIKIVVPTLVGHMEVQRAQGCGAGRPPSRDLRFRRRHLLTQSDASAQVMASSTRPLTTLEETSVRGYSREDSSMPTVR